MMHVKAFASIPGSSIVPDTRTSTELLILVVDDDADMRLYVRGCLRAMSIERVLEAADGREALHLARGLTPDLIISDVIMPGLDGLALCRALKADIGTRSIPILLLSGETRGPPTEGDGFLAKPFNATRLRAEVERLIASPL
jgi:CheY-like chemotaxis protein